MLFPSSILLAHIYPQMTRRVSLTHRPLLEEDTHQAQDTMSNTESKSDEWDLWMVETPSPSHASDSIYSSKPATFVVQGTTFYIHSELVLCIMARRGASRVKMFVREAVTSVWIYPVDLLYWNIPND